MKMYTVRVLIALDPSIDLDSIDEIEIWARIGEKYNHDLRLLSQALVEKGLLAKRANGEPVGYKNLYNAERENKKHGIGHFLNTANRIFTERRKKK